MKKFNSEHHFTIFNIVSYLIVCIIILIGLFDGIYLYNNSSLHNTKESANYRVLRQQGYKNIKLGNFPIFRCGASDDMFLSNTFTAISPYGEVVSGAVCTAFLKGRTIRID
jgi:hypothetical protein